MALQVSGVLSTQVAWRTLTTQVCSPAERTIGAAAAAAAAAGCLGARAPLRHGGLSMGLRATAFPSGTDQACNQHMSVCHGRDGGLSRHNCTIYPHQSAELQESAPRICRKQALGNEVDVSEAGCSCPKGAGRPEGTGLG